MFNAQFKGEVAYEIQEEIGQEGRNSQVFLVKDLHLNAPLVLKKISKTDLGDNIDLYFQEARILYLSSHTNVVPIHYACEENDYVCFAMPHFARGSLKKRIDTEFITVYEIIRYATQFLSGLNNIHSKGLIHFDIKPDNILLSERDEAVLSDFGLAKLTDHSGQAIPDAFYPLHLTPEASLGNDKFTRASDIYQVGLTLYRMCNGNEDFYSQLQKFELNDEIDIDKLSSAVLSGTFPDRKAFLPHIPLKMKQVICKCLEVEPTNRYASAINVVNGLADIDGNDLHWRYSCSNSVKTWNKEVEGKIIRLSINSDGASVATKTIGGRQNRISQYCLPAIKTEEMKRFFKAY